MKVSDLAKQTGVSTHRLRRYDELGRIHAQRTVSDYREFADRVVREMTFIAMSRDLGFSRGPRRTRGAVRSPTPGHSALRARRPIRRASQSDVRATP